MLMPSFEVLDLLADAYTPLLALAVLASIVLSARENSWRMGALRAASLAAGLAVAFGFMLLDMRLGIWPAFGLDYSTHTAVALVLVAFLVSDRPRFALLWIGSLIAYLLLMLYQGYHPLADIVTTAAAVIIPVRALIVRSAQPSTQPGTQGRGSDDSPGAGPNR